MAEPPVQYPYQKAESFKSMDELRNENDLLWKAIDTLKEALVLSFQLTNRKG